MSAPTKTTSIVIAAGGTGGHIMPALSVGRAIESLAPGTRVSYVCGAREQELDWYHAAGIEPYSFRSLPLGRGVIANTLAGLALATNTARAIWLLRSLRVDVVMGMGGYVAAPACFAAKLVGAPVVIHEQNAVLGRTNRRLAASAKIVAGGYREIERDVPEGRFHWTGNPVRESIGELDPTTSRELMGFDPTRPVLAITGGSQGARDVNRLVAKALPLLDQRSEASDWQVAWACGRLRYDECLEAAPPDSFERLHVWMVPFVDEMDAFLGSASLVLARAGASTLAEVAHCGLPSILFPLPSAIGDHQARNADALVNAGAAIRMSEVTDSPEQLADAIADLLQDTARLKSMSEAARSLARLDAAQDLAQLALDVAGVKR